MNLGKCVDCQNTAAAEVIKWQCLPVRSFGGLPTGRLKAVTVGLNPAYDDWLTPDQKNWRNPQERAATDFDYKKSKRGDLTPKDCADTVRRLGEYFHHPNKKWHRYFEAMELFLAHIHHDWSYAYGTVMHIDLIACATQMRFKDIPGQARETLLKNCEKHLLETIRCLPENIIMLLNGSTQAEAVKKLGEINVHRSRVLININGLTGSSGELKIAEKNFVFCEWSSSAASLSIPSRMDLAFWVRDQIKGHF